MDETTKSELEKILHKFEDKAKERSKKDAQQNHEEERYRMEFPRVVKEVIRSTMEEIETFIKKQGHECHIIESDAGIMMDIIPASMHRYAPDQPSIAFFNSPKSASISYADKEASIRLPFITQSCFLPLISTRIFFCGSTR